MLVSKSLVIPFYDFELYGKKTVEDFIEAIRKPLQENVNQLGSVEITSFSLEVAHDYEDSVHGYLEIIYKREETPKEKEKRLAADKSREKDERDYYAKLKAKYGE